MTYDKDHSELDALNREDRAGLSKDPKSNKVQDLDVKSVPVLGTLTPMVRKHVELLRELLGNLQGEPILEKAIGTKIEWYPGKCLTQKLLKKKSRRGGKIITKTQKCDSFFNFFNPPQVPEDGDDIDEEAADLQNEMDMDYEIDTTIRDKIIPHAVSWFTGEAAEGDEFEAVDDDNEEDNEEDDEDEEDKSKGRKA